MLVTGATGFVGTFVCRALTGAGYTVTGLVRQTPKPNDALPGIDYAEGDVTDAATLHAEAFSNCAVVVHLVGIISENAVKGQTFQAVHVGGTKNVVQAAQTAGFVGRFVYVSALGANLKSPSDYSRTKAEAEQIVRQSGLPHTIFRPSIVLGPGCAFLTQIEELVKKPPLSPVPLPFIPVPGNGDNKFQPVWIGDLCAALVSALPTPEAKVRVFTFPGADVVSFNALLQAVAQKAGVKKPLLHAPMGAMFAMAKVLQKVLPQPPITVDQLKNLQTDNVGDISELRSLLRVNPLTFADALARCYPGN